MIDIVVILLLFLLSYLLGSIPISLILGKIFKKIDLRKEGSGNLGSTNAYRVMGLKFGIITFIFDVLKSQIVIFLLLYVIKNPNYYIWNGFDGITIFGVFAVIGHCFSIFIKFKGGKAVASGFGVAITISLYASIAAVLVFIIVLAIKKIVSLSSILGTITIFIGCFIELVFFRDGSITSYIMSLISMIFIVLLILFRHQENIERLQNNTEKALY